MGNPAHETLLRQGIVEWNQWRAENPGVCPDLTGLAMSAANLAGANLSHARLRGARLIRTRLDGSDLRYADLRDAQLHEAHLTAADASRANLDGALLAGARLDRARFLGATLRRAQITVSDLRGADFSEADLEGADLRESMATGASLERSNLTDANVSGCRLTSCNLAGAKGLSNRQLESAIVDETTVLASPISSSGPDDSLHALVAAIEVLQEGASGAMVSEADLSQYHALLSKLASQGVSTGEARITDEELARPITSWDRAPGGEAFELSPVRAVDAALFHRKVDRLLKDIRRQLL